jgi:CHASE1-domain containing sensor protein
VTNGRFYLSIALLVGLMAAVGGAYLHANSQVKEAKEEIRQEMRPQLERIERKVDETFKLLNQMLGAQEERSRLLKEERFKNYPR